MVYQISNWQEWACTIIFHLHIYTKFKWILLVYDAKKWRF